jgi:hypothetical protein
MVLFNTVARYGESEVARFKYQEERRHEPNFAWKVFEWVLAHFRVYLLFLVASVLIALITSGERDMGRAIDGLVPAMILLAPVAVAFFLADSPWWERRPLALDSLPDSPEMRRLKEDPNLSLEELVLKFRRDHRELAHIILLTTKDGAGRKIERGLIMWSSLGTQKERDVPDLTSERSTV